MVFKIISVGTKYHLKTNDMVEIIETWIDMYRALDKTKNKQTMIKGLLRVASELYVPKDCKIRPAKIRILMAATLAKKGNESDIHEIFSLLNEVLQILKS
ncbi:MAG: hypothetical protein N3E50_02175 [Candidatus Goldbacteria bacterium]|nr:hypothetical protein [Candidatus Goldiibacteriota bacterium]